jgi:predicted DNA-binding transcriptional regulator AlpA
MITSNEPTIFLQGISLSDFLDQVKVVTSFENNASPTDEIFNAEEAATFLKVSPATVWRKKLRGEIPYTQIDGRVVFQRSHLLKWLDSKASKVHTR